MLKKSILLSAFVLFSSCLSAQVVRVGLLGYGTGGGSNNSGATIHLIEASYAPKPRFDAGIYAGFGLSAKGANSSNSAISAGVRYGVQGKFYLLTGTIKPFIGLQAGLNSGASFSVDNTSSSVTDAGVGTNFQITPQAGFRLGPINLWASYQEKSIRYNGGFVFSFGSFK